MKIAALFLICISSCALAAEEPKTGAPETLDLGKAESIALRYAPQISAAYFKAEAAKQVIREARSGLFPQITGIASAVGTGNDILNEFGGNHVAKENTRLGATGGLNNPTVFSRESNGVVLSQLITDFGRTANLISAARFQSLSAEQKTRLARAQVILLVDEAYFKVLGAQALLHVANETVAARQLTYDQVSALTKSKLKSELDLSFAKVDLENAKLLVVQTQNAEDEAMAGLLAALGYREQRQFTLTEEPDRSFPETGVQTLIAQALEYRPEIVALRAERDAAVKFTAAERAARFPVISAMGSIGRTPIGDPAVEGNYSAAGINVEVPLFTGGLLTARYNEAALKAKASQKAVDEAEDQVVKDVREAWLNAESALKKIGVTKELLSSAVEQQELAASRYKLGVVSIIELSQAQLNATQAEISCASAKYEYQIDLAKLEYETGALKFRTPNSAVR